MYDKSLITWFFVLVVVVLLVLAGGFGLFGANVQQLIVDLCLSFTSQRVYVVN